MDNQHEELLETLKKEAPGLDFEELDNRSWDIVSQFLVFASSAGLFSSLWKGVELWTSRNATATVKISYTSANGENVEIEYSNRTSKEVNELILKYPPKENLPVKLSTPGRAKK